MDVHVPTYDGLMEKYGFIPFNHQKPNFFPVGTAEIYDHKGRVIPGHKAIWREDTGDTLAIHSDKYSMVPYEEHFEIFERAIAESNLDSGEMRIATDFQDNGAKIFRQYLFPKHTMMLDTKTSSHPIALRIYMFDSYDGSTAWQGRAGFFNFVCANSAIYGQEVDSFRFKHMGDMHEKVGHAAVMLTSAAEKFIANFPRLQRWPHVDIDPFMFTEVLEGLPQGNKTLSDELVARFAREAGGNLWDAHQVLTSWATHGIPAKTQATRQKRVASLVESAVWKHYEEA
jgi:hypothetical protein